MTKGTCFSSDLAEVYSTSYGTVYQSDRENCLFIDFAGKFSRFSFSHFCTLKSVAARHNVAEMLLDIYGAPIEIISFPGSDHCFVLTPVEIAALQDLLDGTFVMLQLNSILADCLHRCIA